MLALSFVHGIWNSGKTINTNPSIDPELIEVKTVRNPRLQPLATIGDGVSRCGECHDYLEVPKEPPRHYVEMHDVTLNHGRNDFCFNCHNPTARETLVDFGGTGIPFSKSDLVCAKCHAAVHRDWESGVHGRVNGYREAAQGAQKKATCVACHDPHDPKFKPLPPAPKPVRNTYTVSTWTDCGRCHSWISKILPTQR